MYELNDGNYELTQEAKEKKYPCRVDLTGDDIETIVITALEGGIAYWATLDNTTAEWAHKPPKFPVSQYATQLLLENKGIKLIDEEDEDKSFEITLQKFIKGVEQYVNNEAQADMDDIDAASVDMIFQYALFGEVIYG